MADEEKKEEKEEAKAEAVDGRNVNLNKSESISEEKTEEVKAEAPVEEPVAAEASAEVGKVEKAPAEEKTEEKVEEKSAEKAEPSGKFKDLIKEIEELSVADLAELVKALEERFGVSASAAPQAAAGAAAGAPAVEEKSSYNVMLKDGGAQKIAVIKAVREINQELGLVDAKNLVDSAPKEVKKDLPKAEAEEAKKKLEAAGATVELV